MPIQKIDLGSYVTPSDYMKFSVGDTIINLLGSGGMAKMHGMRTAGGFVNLGMCTETSDCEQCLKGSEPKLKWMWICYWPEKKVVRLLEVGKLIGDGICQATPKDANFTDYQYIITAVGEKLSRKYKVRLGDKSTLTEEELEKLTPAKEFLIKKYLK